MKGAFTYMIRMHNPIEQDLNRFALGAFHALFIDITADLPIGMDSCRVGLEADLRYIEKRFRNEGIKFLTQKLPLLAKAVERSTERVEGAFDDVNRHFHPVVDGYPRFLSGLVSEVTARSVFAPWSLARIRQICYLFYKLDLGYEDSQVDAVIDNYLRTEKSIQGFERTVGMQFPSIFASARSLVHKVMSTIEMVDLPCKHGPGATESQQLGFAKWTFTKRFESVENVYPAYRYYPLSCYWTTGPGDLESLSTCELVPHRSGNSRFRPYLLLENVGTWKSMKREPHPISQVCLVPKDSRGPRLISMEPVEVMYLQQGLKDNLVRGIESHELTKGFVNFTSQDVNRLLAMDSSITRELATLDLKDASDRVSLSLVEYLFGDYSISLKALRSHSTRMPCGSEIPLRKFAPMGSALCFPVMALTVWALSQAYLNEKGSGNAYVYGDDILVPTLHARGVIEVLVDAGLAVNTDKSFIDGFFRESCGVDAFKGVDVTPTRLKKDPRDKDATTVASYVEVANSLSARGYVELSQYFKQLVETALGQSLPVVPDPGRVGFLCWAVDRSDRSLSEYRRIFLPGLVFRTASVADNNCRVVLTALTLKISYPEVSKSDTELRMQAIFASLQGFVGSRRGSGRLETRRFNISGLIPVSDILIAEATQP